MFATEHPTETQRMGVIELELFDKKKTAGDRLAEAETAAAHAYLAGDGSQTVSQVLRLQEEIKAIDRAIGLLRARRPEILRNSSRAEAREMRKQAASKRAELRNIEERCGALLTKLLELQECNFGPTGTPRSSSLRLEIETLERDAAALDQQHVPTSGVVDLTVTTNDEVLKAVMAYRAMPPTIEQLLAWFEACEATAISNRGGARFGNRERRVRLSWNADGIDVSSYIFCNGLATKRKTQEGEEFYDVTSGTFRPERVF